VANTLPRYGGRHDPEVPFRNLTGGLSGPASADHAPLVWEVGKAVKIPVLAWRHRDASDVLDYISWSYRVQVGTASFMTPGQ